MYGSIPLLIPVLLQHGQGLPSRHTILHKPEGLKRKGGCGEMSKASYRQHVVTPSWSVVYAPGPRSRTSPTRGPSSPIRQVVPALAHFDRPPGEGADSRGDLDRACLVFDVYDPKTRE
jgi:hypothetical protein